jgi:hypothetical protein
MDPEKLVGMDGYGPMYEQLYRGKCGSLVTGVNEYLIFAQVIPSFAPIPDSLPFPFARLRVSGT